MKKVRNISYDENTNELTMYIEDNETMDYYDIKVKLSKSYRALLYNKERYIAKAILGRHVPIAVILSEEQLKSTKSFSSNEIDPYEFWKASDKTTKIYWGDEEAYYDMALKYDNEKVVGYEKILR